MPDPAADRPKDFIREIIDADLQSGRHTRVVTRFPPEPNGYLHIGHAKSICLNFGIAQDYSGVCHLRFDDTNPTTEDVEYVEAIQRDIRWLGFDWSDKLFYASDYYPRLYQLAEELIEKGLAYVCDLSEEQISEYRGTISEPGRPSPFRERSVGENLDLFRRMRAGEFPDGSRVLRGKIDMASANMKMRDPLFYRIKHAHHYRSGDAWCIYPFYDFAHPLSDALEGITHSICTLEFENNREIYDWLIEHVDVPSKPRQYEFARLNLTYTVMSKRKLLELVSSGRVSGWDDPRMPTIAGLRRRGITPEAIRTFASRIGVAKNNSTVEVELFEHAVREDLNDKAPRVLAVLDPLEIVIDNYPERQVEELDAPYWPRDVAKEGSRRVPFSRRIYIDREDFSEEPPKDFFRLAPGREVRLRHAYVIGCDRVEKDSSGRITRLICHYDPATKSGVDGGGRKVKGTIHWVSAERALEAEVRLYDRLFRVELPGSEGTDPLDELNQQSLTVKSGCKLEPSLASARAGERFQFEREGFFFVDPVDSTPGRLVFNRIVALKDSWEKIKKREVAPERRPRPRSAEAAAPARPKEALSAEARALVDRHQLGSEEARVIAESPALAKLLGEALEVHPNARSIGAWIVNELPAKTREGRPLPFGGHEIAELVGLIDEGIITGASAKQVLSEMLSGGGRPRDIVESKGLRQIADAGALEPVVDAVLSESSDAVARYRAGNKNVLGALVGKIMRQTRGQANPKLVSELLEKKLSGS